MTSRRGVPANDESPIDVISAYRASEAARNALLATLAAHPDPAVRAQAHQIRAINAQVMQELNELEKLTGEEPVKPA